MIKIPIALLRFEKHRGLVDTKSISLCNEKSGEPSQIIRTALNSYFKLLMVVTLLTSGNLCYGQSSASASASATIVSPVGMIRNGDITFVGLQSSALNAPIIKESTLNTIATTKQHFTIVGNSLNVYSIAVPASLSMFNIRTRQILKAKLSTVVTRDKANLKSHNTFSIKAILEPSSVRIKNGLFVSKNFDVILSYN